MYFSLNAIGQGSQTFNYQGVLRNSSGELVKNTAINVRTSLIKPGVTITELYSETHSINTNSYGQFAVRVGNGVAQSGNYFAIDWSEEIYLKTEIANPAGGTFIDMGTIQLISVPYSLYSGKAKTLDKSTIYLTDNDTLFAVKDRQGNVIFAVFPDGVKVIVDQGSKGAVGGFAVSGRTPTKAIEEDYFRVTLDSTRIYVNDTSNFKGAVGGFAVSGRTPTKGIVKDYLFVTPDSTRVTFNTSTKGNIGGFAVSGRTPTKESVNSLLNLFKDNYFIGHESGINTTGTNNLFLGYKSGMLSQKGNENVMIGSWAGYENNGNYNVFLGFESGYSNIGGLDSRFAHYNTFLGYQSGRGNTTGWNNVYIGYRSGASSAGSTNNVFIGVESGKELSNGSNNVFIGPLAGWKSTICNNNVFVGNAAGMNNTKGYDNIYIGEGSGASNDTTIGNVLIGNKAGGYQKNGPNNTMIGNGAGYNATGSGNVFLGYNAGGTATGSNLLIIDNSNTSTPLIYGDFSKDMVNINKILNLGSMSTYPASPGEGDIIRLKGHSTNPDGLYIYTGAIWKSFVTW